MDNNKFQQSQNFDHLEKNKTDNPNLDHDPRQVSEKGEDTPSKHKEHDRDEVSNPEKEILPPDDWSNKQKEYDDAWKRNAEQMDTDE